MSNTLRDYITDYIEKKELQQKNLFKKAFKIIENNKFIFALFYRFSGWASKLYVSFFPIGAGAYLSLELSEIIKEVQTKGSLEDKLAWIFIVLSFIWIFCLIWQLGTEQSRVDSRFQELTKAIINAPDSRILIAYPSYYDNANNFPDIIKGNSLADLEDKISLTLDVLLKFTERYFRAYGVDLGANIMIYHINKSGSLDSYIDCLKKNKTDDIIIFKSEPTPSISGILKLENGLSYRIGPNKKRDYKEIIIPTLVKNEGKEKSVPGASTALKQGVSVVEDTSKFSELLSSFEKEDRESVVNYFKMGDVNVGGFISLNLKCNGENVGVLNIDSNKKFGNSLMTYLYTYLSLLYPMTKKLEPLVNDYRNLKLKEEKRNYKI